METEKKYLALEQFKRILDQFPKVRAITLQGCGETLLNPELAEMLTLNQCRNIDFTIVTNGTLLNERNINKLKNVSSVTVSIDSANPERYKEIRGAKLEVVINNLKRLKQFKPDVRLSIQAIIMKETIGSMPQIIGLAQNVGAEQVRLLHLEGFNQELEKKHAHKLDNVINILEKTKKMARKRKINLEIPPLQPTLRNCFEPWYAPRISLEGNIYPCCYVYVSSEQTWNEWFQGVKLDVPQFQYKMGNIFKESFNEIWNGDNYKLLRNTIRKSGKHTTLSSEELNNRREALDLNKSFSYCNVCLYRWNCHC
jgi:MoaA/NifB/PqqE/SkfB family radical SAM enzyme